jgi:hypothetical protein
MFKQLMLITCTMLLLGAAMVLADVPRAINYQALLLDSGGDPAPGNYSMVFTIYDAASGGTVLWTETIPDVQVRPNGTFNVILGRGARADITHNVLNGEPRWLGVAIAGDSEIEPRTEMVSSAYSFRVSTVDQAEAGTIKGSLVVEQSLAKAANASIILIGSVYDTLMFSPADGTLLHATNQSGAPVIDVTLNAGAASLVIKGPGGDSEAEMNSNGMTFSNDLGIARALQKRWSLGSDGLFAFSEHNPDDAIMAMYEMAPGEPTLVMTRHSASKVARELIQFGPPSATLTTVYALRDETGDVMMDAAWDQTGGGKLGFYTSAAGRASRKIAEFGQAGLSMYDAAEQPIVTIAEAVTGAEITVSNGDVQAVHSAGGSDYYFDNAVRAAQRSVSVNANGLTVYSKDSPTDPLVQITETVNGPEILVSQLAGVKASNPQVAISADGVYLLQNGGVDTTAHLSANGNIVSKGQIAVGEGCTWGAAKDGEPNWSVVFGFNNTASGDSSTVSGGYNNVAAGRLSSIGGGVSNNILEPGVYATIGGGHGNYADSQWCTISGGFADTASGFNATIGGGLFNSATRHAATIGGGGWNRVSAVAGTVAGGYYNTVAGQYGFIGGGTHNEASGNSGVLNGWFNYIDTGAVGSAIVAGDSCRIWTNGYRSLVAGYRAVSNYNSCLVWSGLHGAQPGDSVWSSQNGQVVLAARPGGFYFTNAAGQAPYDANRLIQTSTGAYLTTGGVWTDAPKATGDITPINRNTVLGKLEQLLINEWTTGVNKDIRHISPLPDDFHEVFGLGMDNESMSAIDLAGVALAAVQELYKKTQELEQLKTEMAQLQALVEVILARQNESNNGSKDLAVNR